MGISALTIAEVEHETGLTKDQLRVWERRYGFPRPLRDSSGDRSYSGEDVDKLRVVRRLLDRGMRPGRLLGLALTELQALSGEGLAAERSAPHDLALYLLRTHQTVELRKELFQTLMRDGMFRFVTETAAPLTALVGEAWMRGELQVFEEHLFTEMLQGLLRSAISQSAGPGGSPRVLLTTLPNEQHGLGMLMAEALLTLEGAECVSLGVQTPVSDVVGAAAAKKVDLVALSFSANFSSGAMLDGVGYLRAALPQDVALWCGGAGVARARRFPENVTRIHRLQDIGQALASWRASVGTAAARGE